MISIATKITTLGEKYAFKHSDVSFALVHKTDTNAHQDDHSKNLG